jgi:hypothetical protein
MVPVREAAAWAHPKAQWPFADNQRHPQGRGYPEPSNGYLAP